MAETPSYWTEVPQEPKKRLDFSKLVADSHLTKEEKRVISESYETDKQALIAATQGEIRNFILKDYGAANHEALGGMEGVRALQKVLGVKEDGYFGPDTFKALIEYQKTNGLETDAIAGSKTQAKMGISKAGWSAKFAKESGVGTVGNDRPSVSPRENTPVVDATKVLSRYEIRLRGIREWLEDVRKHRDENTGFFNVLADDVVGAFGWSTGKAAYESAYANTKALARDTITQLDKDLNGKYLTDAERNQYLRLRSDFEKCLGEKLGEPNPLVTMKNSVLGIPETAKLAAYGVSGEVQWIFHGLGQMITGVADLSVFLYKYGESWIGSNPEYKNKIDAQMKQVWDFVAENGFSGTGSVVWEAIAKEWDKVMALPAEQQAEAIGKLAGNVIAVLLTLRGWMAIGQMAGKARLVAQWAKAAAETAKLSGTASEASAAALSASREGAKAIAWKVGEFVLNGPAESAIGAALSKTFRTVSTTLRGWASAAHKLKTVESGIADFGNAMRNETNPEKLKYLQEGKSALEKEKDGLVKQLEHKESPKSPASNEEPSVKPSEKPTKKEFVTEWKEPKRILQELSQYYHPDKANHPDADIITKELNRLRAEMKAGKDVRAELEAIAKDADIYVESRGLRIAEAAVKTQHEQFVENLRKYSENFSEIRLRALAPKDAEAFGHALLQKQVLADIEMLAKTEPERAMAEFNEFMSRPAKYLDKKYPAPYSSPDAEARAYARQAYERAYKNEYAELVDRHREAYERFLKESPSASNSMAETFRKVSENIEGIARMLGERFQDFKGQLQEIAQLLKGNVRENLNAIMARIESFAESVRLDPKMGLDLKARISNVLRDIKARLSKSGPEAFASVPEAHYQRVAMEKGVAGINIPRSNGSISGIGAGDFHIVGKEGDDILTVHWKEGEVWKSKEIPRKDFEALNPDFAKPKETWKPRSESGMNENHSERAEPQRKNWVEQAREYNRNAGDSFRERVEDGFADGGRSAKFFDTKEAAEWFAYEKNRNAKNPETRYTVSRLSDGRHGVSNREFIIVDRANDPVLKSMISSMERLKSIANPTERARAMLRFVYEEGEKLSHIKWDPLANSEKLHGSKYLGEIFANDWAAVCRHRSLLVKVLWDELGLETAIRKWYGINPGGKMDPHAWNEIRINGKWYVADTTMVLDNPESLGLYRDMRHLGVLDGNREFVSIYELENARQAA